MILFFFGALPNNIFKSALGYGDFGFMKKHIQQLAHRREVLMKKKVVLVLFEAKTLTLSVVILPVGANAKK